MNDRQFKSYMYAAQSLGGDYAAGYQRGLRRHHHGDKFGTQSEHEKWLSLGIDGDTRQEMGDGYRDGWSGRAPRGMHGNTGNANAAKYERPTWIHRYQVETPEKCAYVEQAQRNGTGLNEFLKSAARAALDADIVEKYGLSIDPS